MPSAPPSLAGLAAKVQAREYAMLTQRGEDVAERAYAAAVAYCEGAATKVGRELDWANATAIEALRKRFVYELYAENESEAVASDKQRDADALLAQLLGDASVVELQAPPKPLPEPHPATAAVLPRPASGRLNGFPGARS